MQKARRWEVFNLRKEDGKWELIENMFFDEHGQLNGWGQFGHNFGSLAHRLLTSDKWEFVETEEEYLKTRRELDKHYKIKE